MRRRRYMRHFFEQLNIFRMFGELVVADQGAEWFSAENSIFIFVNLFEDGALIELSGPLQIFQ
jgi:hypothetical protein